MIPIAKNGNEIVIISQDDYNQYNKPQIICYLVDIERKKVSPKYNWQHIIRDSQTPWEEIKENRFNEVLEDIKVMLGHDLYEELQYSLAHSDEIVKRIIPDWEQPKSIALVWPEGLAAETGKLKDLYKTLITKLSASVSIDLYVNKMFENYHESFNENVKIKKDLRVEDLWIRDFGPFYISSLGKVEAIKAKYGPGYHKTELEISGARQNNAFGCMMAHGSGRPLKIDIELVWDGGNVAYNGAGFGIITNRIISENEGVSIDKIKSILKNRLFLDDILFVPVEPGDDTGHVDGLIRFVEKETVIVADYPEEDADSRAFTDGLVEQIKAHKPELEIKRLTNGTPGDDKYEFSSAVGNYLNFLRIGDVFFVPQYGGQYSNLDRKAIDLFNEISDNPDNVISIDGCTELAEYGGVLNCITKQVYG